MLLPSKMKENQTEDMPHETEKTKRALDLEQHLAKQLCNISILMSFGVTGSSNHVTNGFLYEREGDRQKPKNVSTNLSREQELWKYKSCETTSRNPGNTFPSITKHCCDSKVSSEIQTWWLGDFCH